jgi:hypothetical protein
MHTHAFLFRQFPRLWGNLATIPEATEQCKIFLTTDFFLFISVYWEKNSGLRHPSIDWFRPRIIQPQDIEGQMAEQKLTGKKVLLGTIFVLLLIFLGAVFESFRDYWVVLSLWIIFAASLVALNNSLCKRWFSFDKLQTYKYSWRQFGIITLILLYSRSRTADYAVSHSGMFSGSIALYLFLGYLLFYLSERYLKRGVLNMALKSVPFLIFIVLFVTGLASVYGIFPPTKPKSVPYLDVNSGRVFEISGKDIEETFPIAVGFAKAGQNISLYQDLLRRYMSGTLDHKTFSKETSRIEEEWTSQAKATDSLAQRIESTVCRNLLLELIGFEKERVFALMTVKEGIEGADSITLQMGMELLNKNASRLVQILRDYSSIVRVEPGDQIDEQRSAGLLRVEIVRIQNEIDQYELAFRDFCNEVLTLQVFKQKMNHYESVLTDCFQRCDSLMEHIRDPEALGFLQKYVDFGNIRSSIPHQKFQALSSLVKAYIDYDSAAYSVNYTKYTDLCKKSDELVNDLFSTFLK